MNARTGIALVAALVAGATGCDRQDPTAPGEEGSALGPSSASLVTARQLDPITLVEGGFVCTDRTTVTFDGVLDEGESSSTIDTELDLPGASFAERFDGQTLTQGSNVDGGQSGQFDVLSTAAGDPLTLETGASGENLAVSTTTAEGPIVLAGLGPPVIAFAASRVASAPAAASLGDPFGEGSAAVLFDDDQAGVEITTGGADDPPGTATVHFFARDGSLIDTEVIDELEPAPTGAPGLQTWVFRRSGDLRDVAGFSVHNDDPGGIFYDDVVLCGDFEELVLRVDVDIKPGSDPNSINTNSDGVVPVAILGSDEFDVEDVDASTLRFGPDGAEPAHGMGDPETFQGHLEDVNDDGFTDLVTHHWQKKTGLEPDDEEGCISGALDDGTRIEGCDSVRMLDRGGGPPDGGGGPPDRGGPDDEDSGPDNVKRKADENRRK